MAYQSFAKWTLLSLDTFDELVGQYPLQNTQEAQSAHYESVFSMNRQEPITQWIHGVAQVWTFGTMLRQLDSSDDIEARVRWLQDSVRKDDKLGRPPLYVWNWGTEEVSCFITSIGGVSWDMAPNGPLGPSLRQVTFNITLQKYVPYDIEVTDPGAPPRDTFFKNAQVGATYERMAQERYGDPLWGDHIRRRHPALPYPVAGSVIALTDAENLVDADLEPESPALQRTEEGLNARQELFALRGASKQSHVL